MADRGPGRTMLLEAKGIRKAFGGVNALTAGDLSVSAGETVALIGLNGAGKSTLINILSGALRSDSGTLTLAGRPYAPTNPAAARSRGLAVVYQERTLIPNLSVAENILLGAEPIRLGFLRGRATHAKVAAICNHYGIDLPVRANVNTLGAGERQLVDIVKAMRGEAQLLLLDEPTSALTLNETERLFAVMDQLKSRGVGIVFVSHRLDEVLRVSDRIVILRDGRTVGDVARVDADTETILRLIGGAARTAQVVSEEAGQARPGEEILRVTSLRPGERDVTVHAGEVVGVAGAIGSGCTNLVEFVAGHVADGERRIALRGVVVNLRSPAQALRHRVALLPEKRTEKGILDRLSIRENVSLSNFSGISRLGFIRRRTETRKVQPALAHLDVKAQSLDASVRRLSGGNQQKVVFAKLLHAMPNLSGALFLFDEPTAGVDVRTKPAMEAEIRLLAGHGAGALVANSDLPELVALCDRLYVMRNHHIVAHFTRDQFDQATILHSMLGSTHSTALDQTAVNAPRGDSS